MKITIATERKVLWSLNKVSETHPKADEKTIFHNIFHDYLLSRYLSFTRETTGT